MPMVVCDVAMDDAIEVMACRPEAHCRLTAEKVVEGGMPEWRAAMRPDFAPPSSVRTVPIVMSLMRAGSMPVRVRVDLSTYRVC
jgi:hypothetical protein